jgi:hypothetical protein
MSTLSTLSTCKINNTNKINKINDLFSVIQNNSNTNSITTNEYLNNILTLNDIDKIKLKINWTEVLYMFYQNQLVFNTETIQIIIDRIYIILTSSYISSINQKINYLNRFLHLNAIFEILNELNLSYNQSIDSKNYTLQKLEDYYLSLIIQDESSDDLPNNNLLINHWFDGIYNKINLDLFDGKHKSKYHKGIEVLKKYLQTDKLSKYDNITDRCANIDLFVNKYSLWVLNTLTNDFNNNKMSLTEVFIKIDKLNKINKIFINDDLRSKFLNTLIKQLVPCWKIYLNTILDNQSSIDENIVKAFNSIDLTLTNYHNYNL